MPIWMMSSYLAKAWMTIYINIVMSKLAESGLIAKPSKCEWAKARLVYLGHRVGGGLVAPEDCKVEAVKHFQQPGTKTGARLVYLGHRVGGGLVAPEDCKVEAVKHFQQPGTKTGARLVYLGHRVGGGLVAPEDCKVEAVKHFQQPGTKTGARLVYLGHRVGGGLVAPEDCKVEAVKHFQQPGTKTGAHLVYLGHRVGGGLVAPEDCKVEAVKHFQQPGTKTGIPSFLGLAGYHRRFIPGFADHSVHLTDATGKKAPQQTVWTVELDDEFRYLKQALSSVSVLTIPRRDDVFRLDTDASDVGIGAVLSVRRDGEDIPVAYYSKKLLDRETRYATTEKECLAVVRALHHFGVYLEEAHFTVVTDHKALQYLNSARHTNGRVAIWALQLQPFSFKVQHRAGRDHGNADGLSRQEWRDGLRPQEGGGSVRP